jgi:hypothetical protein
MLGLRDYPNRARAVSAADLAGLLADCVDHEAITSVGPTPASAFEEYKLEAQAVDWRANAARYLDALR